MGVWPLLAGRLYVADAAGASLDTAQLAAKCGGRPATAVINVAGAAFDDRHAPPARAYLNLRVEDSTDASMPFADIFEFVSAAVARPGRFFDVASPVPDPSDSDAVILVHCRGAHSRSLAVAVALFVRFGGVELRDALAFTKRMRGLLHINRGFLEQLASVRPLAQLKCS